VNNNTKYKCINCDILYTNKLQKIKTVKNSLKINFIHHQKHFFISILSTYQTIKNHLLNNNFTPNPQPLLLLKLFKLIER
jgi:hypothetical protein